MKLTGYGILDWSWKCSTFKLRKTNGWNSTPEIRKTRSRWGYQEWISIKKKCLCQSLSFNKSPEDVGQVKKKQAVHQNTRRRTEHDPHTHTHHPRWAAFTPRARWWIVNIVRCIATYTFQMVLKLHFKFRWALSLSWQMCCPVRWGRAGGINILQRNSKETEQPIRMHNTFFPFFFFLSIARVYLR